MVSNYTNPNETGIKGELFGLPVRSNEPKIIFISAPWEATVSGGTGTALAPEHILKNSYKIDLYDKNYPQASRIGMKMLPIPYGWKLKSDQLRIKTSSYMQEISERGSSFTNPQITRLVDQYSCALKNRIKDKGVMHMNEGKLVGLIGGEHSCALGLIEACAVFHRSFGILQLDAHADLHRAYQGFTYSHGSVMYNALKLDQVARITQVGLRDYGQEEGEMIANSKGRILSFTEQEFRKALFGGILWKELCEQIIRTLPDKIYLSIDITGLDSSLCPSTGRPVPGGLGFYETLFLIEQIVESGKQIIAFDLSEVSVSEETDWDAQVASHLLYRVGILMAISQKKL